MKVRVFSLTCMLLLLSSAGAQSSPISLSPASTYPTGAWYTQSVSAIADVNGDGNIDLVAASICSPLDCLYLGPGFISVLLGNGNGTFQPAVLYNLIGSGVVTVKVVDVNADHRPDIVATVQGAGYHGAVGIFLSNGNGTFQPGVFYDSGGAAAMSVTVQDINADGKPDLEVANHWTSGSNTNGLVGVLLGNGDGTFQYPQSFGSGGFYTRSLAVADFNGDGRMDVAATSDCATTAYCSGLINGTVGILLGNGNGAFQMAVPISVSGYEPNSIRAADFNGDRKQDLVMSIVCDTAITCNGSLDVLLGNGDGTFRPVVSYLSGGIYAYSVSVADLNGDGYKDLAAANVGSMCNAGFNCYGTSGVLLGNGKGTFSPVLAYGVGPYRVSSLSVGDVNGDHKPDLVVSDECDEINCQGNLRNGALSILVNRSIAIGAISPLSLTFSGQKVGTPSPAKIISLFNKGNYQMLAGQILFSIAGDFLIQANKCGSGVRPASHCDVYVTFKPKATGTRQGLFTFTDKATNRPQYVTLTGTGIP